MEESFRSLYASWSELDLRLHWAYRASALTEWTMYAASPQAVWFLEQGHLMLDFLDGSESYSAGNWILPRAGYGQQFFSGDAQLISIRMTANWPTGQPLFNRSKTTLIPGSQAIELTNASEHLIDLVTGEFPGTERDLQRKAETIEQHFKIQRQFSDWLYHFIQLMVQQNVGLNQFTPLDERIRHVIRELDRHDWTHAILEADLADSIDLSVSQLNRLFKKQVGCAPYQYLEDRRKRAVQLAMADPSRSVKSIAWSFGFSSLPHFSNWSKKHFGASPRQLRRRAELSPSN